MSLEILFTRSPPLIVSTEKGAKTLCFLLREIWFYIHSRLTNLGHFSTFVLPEELFFNGWVIRHFNIFLCLLNVHLRSLIVQFVLHVCVQWISQTLKNRQAQYPLVLIFFYACRDIPERQIFPLLGYCGFLLWLDVQVPFACIITTFSRTSLQL